MRTISALFGPPRRLHIHRAGWTVSIGALGLGLAAMATGNNLLYLLLGAMLGLITLSGWLSELTLRGLEVDRRVPRGIEAGSSAHVAYEVRNLKRLLPSFAVEIGERRDEARGFLPSLAAADGSTLRVERVWEHRGVHPLETVTLSTSFPFGLFRKERDIDRPGEVVVWPRTTRVVREPRPAGDRSRRSGELAVGASAARGEYRSLRAYVPGDDPRDVHWRSSARTGEPVVREYAKEQAQTLWICVDLRGEEISGATGATADPSVAALPRDDRGGAAGARDDRGGAAVHSNDGPTAALPPDEGRTAALARDDGDGTARHRGRVQVARVWRPRRGGSAAVPRAGRDLRLVAARQEAALEIAASLAARAAQRGQPFALITSHARVVQGTGARHLERVLDTLARARFRPDAPPPAPPASRESCVLVTSGATAGAGWGDVLRPDEG